VASARPENEKPYYVAAEAFVAQVLEGRFELIGKDFEGSSITVPAGAECLRELLEHLRTGRPGLVTQP
jgi:hypothetical protein